MTRSEARDSIFRIIFREAFFPAEGMEEQTEEYLTEVIRPLLAENEADLGLTAEINV